jgi:polysaccharide biosynthesis transport protein
MSDFSDIDAVATSPPPISSARMPSEQTQLVVRESTNVVSPTAGSHREGSAPAILHGFRRRWLLAIVAGVICSGVAGSAAWFSWVPRFTASAYLRLASQQPVVMFETADSSKQTPFDIYKGTQRELIRNRFVLNAALRNPAVAKLAIIREQLDPIEWLQKNLAVSFPGNAEILEVAMKGEDPAAITAIVNATCEAFMEEVVKVEYGLRRNRLQNLEKVRDETDEKVRRKRAEFRTLTETLGTGDSQAATQKQNIALENYGYLRKQLLEVQTQRLVLETKLAAEQPHLEARASASVAPRNLNLHLNSHPEVIAANEELTHQKEVVDAVERRLADGKEKQRIVERHRRAIEATEKRLADVRSRLQPKIEEELRQSLGMDAASTLNDLKLKIEAVRLQEANLSQQVKDLAKEAHQIGRSSVDLEMMRPEISNLESIRNQLATEIESLRVELASASRVEVISLAEAPKNRDEKKRVQNAATFGAIAFFLPVVGICWLDTRKKRVNSAAEVTDGLGLRMIGSMPLLPQRAHRSLGGESGMNSWSQLLLESVDSIREVVMREHTCRGTKVVMVTSALGGEGKTTIASQMALSFARCGYRTVLVDFDLWRPSTHLVLNQSVSPGLAEYLRSEREVDEILLPTSHTNLFHVAAGLTDGGDCPRLLSRGKPRVELILKRLRDSFDMVVVDTSPVLPVVDSLIVGQFVDAALISVMRDVSEGPRVIEAVHRLDRLGVPVLGCVVTCQGSRAYGSQYRYSNSR